MAVAELRRCDFPDADYEGGGVIAVEDGAFVFYPAGEVPPVLDAHDLGHAIQFSRQCRLDVEVGEALLAFGNAFFESFAIFGSVFGLLLLYGGVMWIFRHFANYPFLGSGRGDKDM